MYSRYDFSPEESWRNTNILSVSSFFFSISTSNSWILLVAAAIWELYSDTFAWDSVIWLDSLWYSACERATCSSWSFFCCSRLARLSSNYPNVLALDESKGFMKRKDTNMINNGNNIFFIFIISLDTSLKLCMKQILQLVFILSLIILIHLKVSYLDLLALLLM